MKFVLIAFCFFAFAECFRGSRPRYCKSVTPQKVITLLESLAYVGENNSPFIHNRDDYDQYCSEEVQEANDLVKIAKCFPVSLKEMLKSFAISRRRHVVRNCRSRDWFKNFIDFSSCHQSGTIHQCGYKLSAAFKRALQYDVEYQLPYACCALFEVSECIHREVEYDCNAKLGGFALDLFWEPVEDVYDMACPGVSRSQCERVFDNELQDLKEIFHSKQPVPSISYMSEALLIAMNMRGQPPVHFSQLQPAQFY